jgi:hypothetical protein
VSWNTIDITFAAPGWLPVVRVEYLPAAQPAAITVIDIEKDRESNASLRFEQFSLWLHESGFQKCEEWRNGKGFRRNDVIIEVYYDDEMCVSQAIITLHLQEDSPTHWTSWYSLIDDLLNKWGLIPTHPSAPATADSKSWIDMVAKNDSFISFSTKYGWESDFAKFVESIR